MNIPYSGEINIQHNGDLLIIGIQTKTKMDDATIQNHPHLESNPYLYQHLEINKSTGDMEKMYMGPWDL